MERRLLSEAGEGRTEQVPEKEELPGKQDVSEYCPACSVPLEPRLCKLICTRCGYYMSCSDYY